MILRCCRNPCDLECDASRADRAAHSCLLWSCWWAKAWSAKEGTAAVFGNTCKNLQPLHEFSHDAYRTTWRHEHMWEGFERGDISLDRKITLTNLSAWMLASQDTVRWTPWTTFEKTKWKTAKYWKIRKIHGSMARRCRFLRFETQDMKMTYSNVWCQKDGRRWSVVKFYGLRFLQDIKVIVSHAVILCHAIHFHHACVDFHHPRFVHVCPHNVCVFFLPPYVDSHLYCEDSVALSCWFCHRAAPQTKNLALSTRKRKLQDWNELPRWQRRWNR